MKSSEFMVWSEPNVSYSEIAMLKFDALFGVAISLPMIRNGTPRYTLVFFEGLSDC